MIGERVGTGGGDGGTLPPLPPLPLDGGGGGGAGGGGGGGGGGGVVVMGVGVGSGCRVSSLTWLTCTQAASAEKASCLRSAATLGSNALTMNTPIRLAEGVVATR